MKIAILGTIPYSKMRAPFDDPEWEIWVCSPGNKGTIPRVTRWFELHGIDEVKGPENAAWNKDYFDWLREQSFPVYMQEPNDLVPNCLIFPQKAWVKEFGAWGRMAATSSISIMVGFAIMAMGRRPDGSGGSPGDTIGVFGVDMQADEEQYTLQKSGCQIMMQIAKERGVDIQVPLSSCLTMLPPFYGYDLATCAGRRLLLRRTELEQELNNCQGQIEHWLRRKENIAGQIQQLTYVMRTFVDGVNDTELDIDEHVTVEPDGNLKSVFTLKGTNITLEEAAAMQQAGIGAELKEFPHQRPVVIPGVGVVVPGEVPGSFDLQLKSDGSMVPKEYLAVPEHGLQPPPPPPMSEMDDGSADALV